MSAERNVFCKLASSMQLVGHYVLIASQQYLRHPVRVHTKLVMGPQKNWRELNKYGPSSEVFAEDQGQRREVAASSP